MMSTDKKDYLSKYLPKKTSSKQSNSFTQVKIIDPEAILNRDSSGEEEEIPSLYNPAGLNLTTEQTKMLLKKGVLEADFIDKKDATSKEANKINKVQSGKWVTISNIEETKRNENKEKNNDSNSNASSIRKRHDSDSDENENESIKEKNKKEKEEKNLKRTYAQALGIKSDSDISVERDEENEEEINENPTNVNLNEFAEQFKNAETVYRNEKGVKIDLTKKYEDKKAELLRKNQERILEWGRGAVQKQEKDDKKKEQEKLKKENFANYEISKETEKQMMGSERFGDPMKQLTEKDNEKGKKKDYQYSGLKKKCKFRGTPNRFGIEPGHRWDGVDRSNGYEKKYLASINQRKLDKEQKDMQHLRDM